MLRILLLLLCCNHAFAQETKKPSQAWTSSIHWSPDNKLIYSTSYDSSIHCWAVQSGQLLATLRTEALVMRSTISPDGNTLAVHLEGGKLEIWNLRNRKKIASHTVHADGNFSSSFSVNSDTLVTASSNDDYELFIYLWNTATGEQIGFSKDSGWRQYWVSPHAEQYLKITKEGVIRVTDTRSFKSHTTRVDVRDSIRNAAISYDLRVMGVLVDAGVKLYNLHTKDSVGMINTNGNSIRSFSFDPRNKFVVTIAYNGDIACWDRNSGKLLVNLGNYGPQDYGWITRISYHRNSSRLAISYDGNKVAVWDVNKKKKLALLEGSKHLLMPVFNKHGNKLLLSEGYEGISIWDVNSGKRWKTYWRIQK
jgi:WD40 repeat protein